MPVIPCKPAMIGKHLIGEGFPAIAVSAYGKNASSFLAPFRSGARSREALYEIRYDLFAGQDSHSLPSMLQELNDMEIDYIFTFRSTEGENLQEIYGTASDLGVPAVDIEIDALPHVSNLKFQTRILSHHSYEGGSVAALYDEIMKHGPDIVKLASAYRSYRDFRDDLARLEDLKRKDARCLSFIPMGVQNRFLRIFSAYTVSDLVYAREDDETAEGQLSSGQYSECFRLF